MANMNLKIYFICMFIYVNNSFSFALNYSTTENTYESQKNINLLDNQNDISNLTNVIKSTTRKLEGYTVRLSTERNEMKSNPFSFSEASSLPTTNANKTSVAIESSTYAISIGNNTNALDTMEEILPTFKMTEASMLNATTENVTENNNHTMKASSPLSIDKEKVEIISYFSNSSTNHNSSEARLKHTNITSLKSNVRKIVLSNQTENSVIPQNDSIPLDDTSARTIKHNVLSTLDTEEDDSQFQNENYEKVTNTATPNSIYDSKDERFNYPSSIEFTSEKVSTNTTAKVSHDSISLETTVKNFMEFDDDLMSLDSNSTFAMKNLFEIFSNDTSKELQVLKDGRHKSEEKETISADMTPSIDKDMPLSERFSPTSSIPIDSTNKSVVSFSSGNEKYFTTIQSQLPDLVNKSDMIINPIETQVPKSIDHDFSQANASNPIYHDGLSKNPEPILPKSMLPTNKTIIGTISDEDGIAVKAGNIKKGRTFAESIENTTKKFGPEEQFNNYKVSTESSNDFNSSNITYPQIIGQASSKPTTNNIHHKTTKSIDEESLNKIVLVTSKSITTSKLSTGREVRNETTSSSKVNHNLSRKKSTNGKMITTNTNHDNLEHSQETFATSTPKIVTSQKALPLVCSNPSCVKVANDIRSSIGKNPCTDPVKFVCGNNRTGDYFEIPDDRSSWGLIEKTEQQYLDMVENLMSADTLQTWRLSKAARHLFNQCQNKTKIEDTGNEIWKSLSEELGGFPIAQRFWRESAYDWIVTNAKITKRFELGSLIKAKFDTRKENTIHIKLGESLLPMPELLNYNNNPPLLQGWINLFYETIEELWFVADSGNFTIMEPQRLVSKDNITTKIDVTMTSTSTEHLKNDSKILQNDLLHSLIDDNLKNTGNAAFRSKRSFLWMLPNTKEGSKVPDRNYFDIQVNETINFEIQLASLIDHFSLSNSSSLTFSELLNKSEAAPVIKDFARLNFEKILRNIFEKENLPFQPEKYRYVVNPSQMLEFQILLSSYQPRDIANVFGWRVLQQLLDHMPHQFRKLKFEFDEIKCKIKQKLRRASLCSGMVLEYFPLVTGHILYDNIDSRRSLHAMKKLRHEVRKGIKENLSSDGLKLEKFLIDVSEPEWIFNRNIIETAYKDLNISAILNSNHYLSTLMMLSSWKRQQALFPIQNNANMNKFTNFGKPSIFNMENSFIPNYLMKYPMFDPSMTHPINYAGIGFLMYQNAMNDISKNYPNIVQPDNLATFVQLFQNSENMSEAKMTLPSLEELTPTQTMLIWFVKTWGCGNTRENVLYHPESHSMRQKLLNQVTLLFNSNFDCDRPQFRDRPQFNIGNFLQKEDNPIQ